MKTNLELTKDQEEIVEDFIDGLAAGEAVCLRIIEGKRGRMAVQVMSWEAAARQG